MRRGVFAGLVVLAAVAVIVASVPANANGPTTGKLLTVKPEVQVGWWQVVCTGTEKIVVSLHVDDGVADQTLDVTVVAGDFSTYGKLKTNSNGKGTLTIPMDFPLSKYGAFGASTTLVSSKAYYYGKLIVLP